MGILANANQCAFPIEDVAASGLTKREFFAAMAMQGILASEAGGYDLETYNGVAIQAVMAADELLTELAQTEARP